MRKIEPLIPMTEKSLIEREVRNRETLERKMEEIIDSEGFGSVMNAISNICFEKGQHIRESYGYHDPQAKDWDKRGSKIARSILT